MYDTLVHYFDVYDVTDAMFHLILKPTVRPIIVVGALISAVGFAGLGPSHLYSFLPE